MSTDDQSTADLRRDVRRLVEVATHAQLEAISTAWLCAAESQAAAWAEAFKEADIAAPGQWELRLTSAALPVAPATPSLKPGQRVAIPARYCGEGCYGVRVARVGCYTIPPDATTLGVEVDGYVDRWGEPIAIMVPIGEVEP